MPLQQQAAVPSEPRPDDRAALIGELFKAHNRMLVAFLTARLQSEADARDVAQEAYVRLLQLDQPGAVSFLRAYLFRIATNLAIDRLRARAVRDRVLGDPANFEEMWAPSPEARVMAQQELVMIRNSLPGLPQKSRQAFLLHVQDGLSTEQIGAQLGITRRMARLHVVRALVYLRGILNADGNGVT